MNSRNIDWKRAVIKLPRRQGAHVTTPFETAMPLRGELLSKYAQFYATFWHNGHVPRRTLELCRRRIAAIHDCACEWSIEDAAAALSAADADHVRHGRFAAFDEAERAALAVAEKMPFQHHDIDDEDVERVRAGLGEAGTVTLMTALAFFDATARLRIVMNAPDHPAKLTDIPLRDGALY
jgi:alkylhydroperoxidase family enzyme